MKTDHTTCKACGHQIAKSAKTCPVCGAKRQRITFRTILTWMFALFLITAAVHGFIDASAPEPGSPEAIAKAEAREARQAEREARREARQAEHQARREARKVEREAERQAEQAERDRHQCNTGLGAGLAVRTAVKRGLKPRKARIPLLELGRYNIGDCRYIITSHVDTVNGFNAPIRLYFVGVERYSKSTHEWFIESDVQIGSEAEVAGYVDRLASE